MNKPEQGHCHKCDEVGPIGTACTSASCVDLFFVDPVYLEGLKHHSNSLVGQMIGDFLVVKPLGQGGFGSVYLALKRPNFHTKGALKIFDPAIDDGEINTVLKRYFMREIKTLSTLNEPNIVQLIDEGVHETSPYLVMRYVEGGTLLRQHMTLGCPAPADFVRDVVTQIIRALKAAHGAGIVHRDLKPENIMLQGEANHIYVLDFGLAKRVDERFLTTATFGTPYYMAPEQLFPSRKELFVPYWKDQPELAVLDKYVGQVGPACDLYALGIMVGELMAGRPIFQSHTTAELSVEKDRNQQDPIHNIRRLGLPQSVLQFLAKAVAYKPDDRFLTTDEFLGAFQGAVETYETFLRENPNALVSENFIPPKDRTSVAFHSTRAVEEEAPSMLGLADTQAISERVAVGAHAAQDVPMPVRLPRQLSRPAYDGPPPVKPGDAQSKPTSTQTNENEDLKAQKDLTEDVEDEPIYKYDSPLIIYGLIFLVCALLGTVAYLVYSNETQPTIPKTLLVETDYDRALKEVRALVLTIPDLLEQGEYQQAIDVIEKIDKSEARLTPKEHQSVVVMLKVAKSELPDHKLLMKAKSHFEKERYAMTLSKLIKIRKTSQVRKLDLYGHVEMAAIDSLMRTAYNDILLRNDKRSASTVLQTLLRYDPTMKDARALLLKINAMPMDAPMAMPAQSKTTKKDSSSRKDTSPKKQGTPKGPK